MGLLDGVKVIDMATLFAGPFIATLLGDHGADVIKIEHPRGDDARHWGGSKDGVSLWWKVISRNKRNIAIDLNTEEGQEIVKTLVKEADILVENYRPGRMEKWNLGYEDLRKINPRLIMARVTGFGQEGPYHSYAGFGTLAESMSGFAAVTGQPDGPPTLPAFGLADGVTGISGAFAVTSALYKREQTGVGEVIDLALYEPLMWVLGAHIIEYDQLGKIQTRTGNQSPRTCPRNTYQTGDGRWIALSASAESIAKRVFQAIGRPDMIDDPKYKTNTDRLQHKDEVDQIIGDWAKTKTQNEALRILREADAAVSPIYDASQIVEDEHFLARKSVITVADEDLGPIRMQGVFPRIPHAEGKVRFAGVDQVGAFTDDVLQQAGYSEEMIHELREKKVVK